MQRDLDDLEDQLRDHDMVPVHRTLRADTITPVSSYLNLTEGENPGFLLESVEQGGRIGRYSFLGTNPRAVLRVAGSEVTVSGDLHVPEGSDPIDRLRSLIEGWNYPRTPNLPPFTGGLVGYLGYETIQFIEPTVPVQPADGRTPFPDVQLYLIDRLIAFDHLRRKIHLIGHLFSEDETSLPNRVDELEERFDRMEARLRERPRRLSVQSPDTPLSDRLTSNFSRGSFKQAVCGLKERIRAGDIFQAVPSQRFELNDPNHPFQMYRTLRGINPSPYMFYLDFDELKLVGASPEVMVQVQGDTVRVRPIAGTRSRGDTPEEDNRLANELRSDAKEQAEHTMLVDLGRNDLGRVCRAGTVTVTQQAVIERYSHVMHLVSNVEGTLRSDTNALDAFRATFPAGTVTGAPKIRAMQLIEGIEPDRRGPYGGAVGYIGFGGDMDSCIVLRTIVAHEGTVSIQAGAGIVSDSDPDSEYDETRDKAEALLTALDSIAEEPFLE